MLIRATTVVAAGVAILLTGQSPSAQSAAGDWPTFRGTRAAGWAEGAPLPVVWDLSTGHNVRWRASLPGRGHSSPVIAGGRLFVTAAIGPADSDPPTALGPDMTSADDGGVHEWQVLAFDAGTGRPIWTRTARRGTPRTARHPFNTFATPTPATDGLRVVAFFGSEGLYCYDREGRLLWHHDFGPLPTGDYADQSFQWGAASSPVIFGGFVIVQCDVDRGSFLAAFRLDSGDLAWKVARADLPSWSTPTIADAGGRAALVVAAPSYVTAYDPRNGAELWRYYWGMDIVEATPIASASAIYASSGKGRWSPIVAIRPTARGDITPSVFDGHADDIVWRRDSGGPITTSLLLYRGLLYALADQGVLRCFDPDTGELIYERRVAGSFLASPVAGDGKLYLSSLDGDVHVVEAGRSGTLLATSSAGATLIATPAIAGGTIYFRTPKTLIAISAASTQ